MKRKIFLALLMFSLSSGVVSADDSLPTLVISLKDGTSQYFHMEDLPKVSFSASDVIVKSNLVETSIDRGDVERFYFEASTNAINSVEKGFDFSYSSNKVSVLGVDGQVAVYTAGGMLIGEYGADGSAVIDMSGYQNGVYIIKVNNKTIKIQKR